jgi:CHAT domain-containing protein
MRFTIFLLLISYGIVPAQDASLPSELLENAYVLQDQGKRDSAILNFINAGIEFKASGNWDRYVECLAGENRNYLATDRIGDVKDKGQEALDIVQEGKANDVNTYFIEILTQLARVNWYAMGNYARALELLNRATEICDKADFDVQKHRLKIRTEYGYTYGYSGEFDLSEENFQKALELSIEMYGNQSEVVADRYTDVVFPLIQKSEWEKAEIALKKATELNIGLRGPDHPAVMKNYNNLGYIYLEKFDNDQAILYINKALTMIRDRFGESHRSIGIGYMNLGASYSNKGDHKTGIKYAKMAIQNMRVSMGKNTPFLGTCFLNIANGYNQLQLYDSAEKYYEKALDLRMSLYGREHHEVVNMYRYFTEFYLNTQQYEEAFAYSREAIEIASMVLPEKHKHSANSHLALSECYAATNQYVDALTEVQLAIMGLVPSFNDTDPASNPELPAEVISTRILLEAMIHKLKILNDHYAQTSEEKYLRMAYDAAETADKLIDILRIEYQTPDSKEILLSRSKAFYENAINVAITLHAINDSMDYLEQAFHYMEKSKSILLLENMLVTEEFAQSTLPDSISIAKNSLARSISFFKEQIYEAENQQDSVRLAELKEEFFQKKRDYDLLLNDIEENYPDYFSVKLSTIETSIQSVQDDLVPGSLQLNFFYGLNDLFVIGITKSDVFYYTRTLDDELGNSINRLIKGFEQKEFDPYRAHFLYQEILEPGLVHAGESIDELILLPDGILHYLPLETLVVSNKNEPTRFLIQNYAISYMHSTALNKREKDPAAMETSYIGFSPRYNKTTNPLLASRSARDVELAGELELLPMAEKEVIASASIWDGKPMLDEEATEENFKRLAGTAGIIHIASHAIIDDTEPMNSKLVFSPGADSIEDGLLHTYELYNMKLNAELACLSACNTGFGRIKSGEGVVSLAKGFFYAGVPNIMMSLWSVPDQSTSEIMRYFYEELKKGEGKADALRTAKLKYLEKADENLSDPYYWAAFTIIGDNEPVEVPRSSNTWIWTLVLLVSIPAVVILVKKWV